jgi:cytochrome c oxidase cbb3-type subunit 3
MTDPSTEDTSVRKSDPDYGTHAYDGIEENDNPLPTWWQWTLYGAIAFAVLYWFDVQVFHIHKTAREKYDQQAAADAQRMADQAIASGSITNDVLVSMSHNPSTVAEGRDIFTSTCASCHRADGGGLVGPNLTDGYWLHGDQPVDIYKTVHDGWPAKGMPNWSSQLGDKRVAAAVAYVLTLKDKNVAGGKAPQGEQEQKQ